MLASLHTYRWDVAAFVFNVVLFAAYRVAHRLRSRRDPGATLQATQAETRAAWVVEVLAAGNGLLGVQTLRNAIMSSVFFASNTMFLVMGTLSLTAHAGGLAEAWSAFDTGSGAAAFIEGKLLVLLICLLASFYCFVNAIRLFVHASVSISTRSSDAGLVTAQIERGWRYQGLGVRGYYFAAPIVFWCFGPAWFAVAGLLSISTMYVFDDTRAWH